MRSRVDHLVVFLAICLLFAATGATGADNAKAISASDGLSTHLAFMKDIRAIETRFTCEKRLQALDSPLVSYGTIWIARPNNVRFSTQKPYLSELILHEGKVLARNQHQPKWTKANQSSRPGLAAVMGQLAAWSVGETASIGEFYKVSKDAAGIPAAPDQGWAEAAATQPGPADLYLLKPTDKALAETIRDIRLGIDRETHALRYVEIVTVQGDETRYWFRDVRLNPELPPHVFTPEDAK